MDSGQRFLGHDLGQLTRLRKPRKGRTLQKGPGVCEPAFQSRRKESGSPEECTVGDCSLGGCVRGGGISLAGTGTQESWFWAGLSAEINRANIPAWSTQSIHSGGVESKQKSITESTEMMLWEKPRDRVGGSGKRLPRWREGRSQDHQEQCSTEGRARARWVHTQGDRTIQRQ